MPDTIPTTKNLKSWWDDPWWLNEEWYSQLKLNKYDVERKFDYLKGIFTEDWFKGYENEDDYVQNVLLRRTLIEKSIFALSGLIDLSKYLKHLESINGIKTVINNLKSSTMSDSAYMELGIGYTLSKGGYNISFLSPKSRLGKTPDISASYNGEEIVVECKSLLIWKYDAWTDAILSTLSMELMRYANSFGYAINYAISEKIFFKLYDFYKDDISINKAISIIRSRLFNSIESVYKKGWEWSYIYQSEMGEGLLNNNKDTNASSIDKPDMPDFLKYRRLMTNGIERALVQIRQFNKPGIAAVLANGVPDYDCLRDNLFEYFKENPDNNKNILGVIIFPWQSYFERTQPCFVVNKFSGVDITNMHIASIIDKYHKPIWK